MPGGVVSLCMYCWDGRRGVRQPGGRPVPLPKQVAPVLAHGVRRGSYLRHEISNDDRTIVLTMLSPSGCKILLRGIGKAPQRGKTEAASRPHSLPESGIRAESVGLWSALPPWSPHDERRRKTLSTPPRMLWLAGSNVPAAHRARNPSAVTRLGRADCQ